jgi:hypothetical protein
LKESWPLFKVGHYSEVSLEKIAIDFGKLGIRVVVEDRWSLFRGLSVFIFPQKYNLKIHNVHFRKEKKIHRQQWFELSIKW